VVAAAGLAVAVDWGHGLGQASERGLATLLVMTTIHPARATKPEICLEVEGSGKILEPFLLVSRLLRYSFGGLLLLRTERLALLWVSFEPRAFKQVDAVRDRGHDGSQAFTDGSGLARQVDDECFSSNSGRLTTQDGCGDLLERNLPHKFPKPRHHFLTDVFRRLRSNVADGRSGASGGDYQAAAEIVRHSLKFLGDQMPIV